MKQRTNGDIHDKEHIVICDRLDTVEDTLWKINENLKTHMSRSDSLKEIVDHNKMINNEQFGILVNKIDAASDKIKASNNLKSTSMYKMGAAITALTGVLYFLWDQLKHLFDG